MIIIRLLCLFGCLFQLYHTCEVYFNYPITVNLDIIKANHYEMPALSLCREIKRMKSLSKLWQKYKTNEFPVNYTFLSPFLLDEITLKASDLEINYTVYENKIGKQEVNSSGVVTHINRGFKCFTLFSKSMNETNTVFNQTDYSSTIINFELKFNTSDNPIVDYFRLMIHPSHQIVSSPYRRKNIQISQNLLKDITFKRVLIHSLPAPYETNCINYSQIGFRSKIDCINQCLISVAKKRCNRWPAEIFAPKTVNHSFLPKFLINECLEKISEKYCNHKCQYNDCIEEILTVEELNSFDEKFAEKYFFYIWFPLSHDYRYEYKPTFAFVEFINYIGGIISLWFGLSFLSFSINSIEKLRNLFENKSKIFNKDSE